MKFLIHTGGHAMKTPYDDKIAEAEQMLKKEENPAYLPQLYKIEGVDLAEVEPEQWPKENPYISIKSPSRCLAEEIGREMGREMEDKK